MKAKVNMAGKFCLFVLVMYKTQATESNTLYKLAERKSGCVKADSSESCPISWKLSAIAAKFYHQQTRQVSRALTALKSFNASDECKAAFNTTMCGQGAPRCLADGSQDYGDAAATCAKIYSKCPQQNSDFLKSQKLCDNIISGKIETPKCVKPSYIEGNCPQPKYKMPDHALSLYKRFSADNETIESLAQVNASSQCKSEVQKMQCVAVYCSEDEKHLLTEFTKAECLNTTKMCVIDEIEKLIKAVPYLEPQLRPTIEKFQDLCDVYPDGSIKLPVGPTGSGNIPLVHRFVLLLSFIVGKLFA